jgi:hypothetical protein
VGGAWIGLDDQAGLPPQEIHDDEGPILELDRDVAFRLRQRGNRPELHKKGVLDVRCRPTGGAGGIVNRGTQYRCARVTGHVGEQIVDGAKVEDAHELRLVHELLRPPAAEARSAVQKRPGHRRRRDAVDHRDILRPEGRRGVRDHLSVPATRAGTDRDVDEGPSI